MVFFLADGSFCFIFEVHLQVIILLCLHSDVVPCINCFLNGIVYNMSVQRAEVLGREDEFRLLKNRQLALLVDLDQTLLHTTNDNIPPNLKVSFYCFHVCFMHT